MSGHRQSECISDKKTFMRYNWGEMATPHVMSPNAATRAIQSSDLRQQINKPTAIHTSEARLVSTTVSAR
jgi:hypothetical protein